MAIDEIRGLLAEMVEDGDKSAVNALLGEPGDMGIWLFPSLSVKILRRGRTRRWNALLKFPKENGRV